MFTQRQVGNTFPYTIVQFLHLELVEIVGGCLEGDPKQRTVRLFHWGGLTEPEREFVDRSIDLREVVNRTNGSYIVGIQQFGKLDAISLVLIIDCFRDYE
ncbi:hypothetical protein D3C78_1687690 [compost metagenome]